MLMPSKYRAYEKKCVFYFIFCFINSNIDYIQEMRYRITFERIFNNAELQNPSFNQSQYIPYHNINVAMNIKSLCLKEISLFITVTYKNRINIFIINKNV